MNNTMTMENSDLAFANVGLPQEYREQIIPLLNTLLSDEHLLYIKTRNYHWNLTGPEFYSLHQLFEEQYNELQGIGDIVAEHARMLGGYALGTMTEFLEQSRLQELPGETPSARTMVATLLDDHGTIMNALREDIDTIQEEYNDESTADMLIATLRAHEKMAWMLRSLLSGTSVRS